MPALVGGGLRAQPGEISLAHNGVLFLDEMPEFSAQVLDSLRQPLETGAVAIARVNHRITYPARFMLVAAINPCRCGRANDPGFACKRGPNTRCVADYQGRLSGPLLDRIDLHIEVPAVTAADLILPPPSEGSREVAARVARARGIQVERYAALGLENVRTNAQAHGPVLEEIARADGTGLALLRDAADSMRLSARGEIARLAITVLPPALRSFHHVRACAPRRSRRGMKLQDSGCQIPPHRRAREHGIGLFNRAIATQAHAQQGGAGAVRPRRRVHHGGGLRLARLPDRHSPAKLELRPLRLRHRRRRAVFRRLRDHRASC